MAAKAGGPQWTHKPPNHGSAIQSSLQGGGGGGEIRRAPPTPDPTNWQKNPSQRAQPSREQSRARPLGWLGGWGRWGLLEAWPWGHRAHSQGVGRGGVAGGSEGRQREEDYPAQVQPPALSCPPCSAQLSNAPVIHDKLRVPPSFASPSPSGSLEVRLLPCTGNSNPLRRPPSPLGARWRWQLFGQTAQ